MDCWFFHGSLNALSRKTRQRVACYFFIVVSWVWICFCWRWKQTQLWLMVKQWIARQSLNKAMSIAYKYAAFKHFCITRKQQSMRMRSPQYAPNTRSDIEDFTNSVMAITISIFWKKFGETWKLLRKTLNNQKQREVYNIRKSELEAI